MDMYESEKNLLEKLADAIPGIKGYRDKESRRDTDKRFREYLARRIEAASEAIEELKREILNEGNLDELDDLERIAQKMFKASNSIRHATYGYSGFFDQVKIQENELDRIYQYDLSLLADVEAVEAGMKEQAGTVQDKRKSWEKLVSALERRIEDRKNLFTVTG